MTEIRFRDFDGNLSYCSNNFAIQRAKYDSKGRWLETSHFDIEDKQCYIKNNSMNQSAEITIVSR